MNWIKVEPNPADNDNSAEKLPLLEQVVHVIYLSDYDDSPVMALGGRVDDDGGWLWAINDNAYGWGKGDKTNDLTADDKYRVTHWAEIEWPKEFDAPL